MAREGVGAQIAQIKRRLQDQLKQCDHPNFKKEHTEEWLKKRKASLQEKLDTLVSRAVAIVMSGD